ncbi:glycoside hydrolase family 2 protein [Paenibacillus thermotolerans]|uniref:glycoside hydrolase family 2 protein n=1 Tax=Paenibacillus thermotolerans TaxID=3027807 RepID=UPI002367A091|nr:MULTISPECIES: glycoside hydrolase family 2 TIM barrel-domain containing protein [unclassified Paenibacillus]
MNQEQQNLHERTAAVTLRLQTVNGLTVPFQNGIPVPSFEPQNRLKLDLGGEWRKKRFDADHGLSLAPRDEAWFKRVQEAEGPLWQAQFPDESWDTRTLPLPENRLLAKEEANSSETYENGVWYRRTFRPDEAFRNKALTLHALGVSYVCDVWVNGSYAGMHEGGFTPFAMDITPHVRIGEPNTIAIRVDNPPWGSRDDVIPAQPGTDFFNYTGVIHDLYIEAASPVHIARADVVPLDPNGRFRVSVAVENRSSQRKDVVVDGTVYEADTESPAFKTSPRADLIKGDEAQVQGEIRRSLTLQPNETAAFVVEASIGQPKLWSVYEPNLYVLELQLKEAHKDAGADSIDTYATQFGIRTVRTEGRYILLNEKPVFLAGIARHEEWPDTGRTARWDRIWSDMEHIAAMHANFVRTAHYPNHIYTSIVTDRLGLLTVSEIPLWQFETKHFEKQEERRLSDQMWREMVFSQYNRPSVLMWSTQNESSEVPLRKIYNERLVNDLRSNYNDGRLLTQSAAADQPGYWDDSMEPLDAAGWTMYFGIFHGSTYYEGTRKFLEDAGRRWPDKPIWNTEFGHWSGQADSEAHHQVETYRETFRALMERATLSADGTLNEHGMLAGIDFWIMYDWYVNHNQWIDTFGMFHMDRKTEKPVTPIIREDYRKITGINKGFPKE